MLSLLVKDLEEKYEATRTELTNLQHAYKTLEIKNTFYLGLLKQNGVDITCFETTCVPQEAIPSPVKPPKKVVFRAMSKTREITEKELGERKERNTQITNEKKKNSVDREEIKNQLNANFEKLGKRHTTAYFTQNRKLVSSLLDDCTLTEYCALLTQNEEIYGKHGYTQNKHALSPLDTRCLGYYLHSASLTSELHLIEKCKNAWTRELYKETLVPFDFGTFIGKIPIVMLHLLSTKELLSALLYNPYQTYNIAYIPSFSDKSIEDGTDKNAKDKYRFFTLDRIEGDNRLWKLDCRLDSFTGKIGDFIREKCMTLFRTIYLAVFGDNIYRANYRDLDVLCREDCQRLLLNGLGTCKDKTFQSELREIVSACKLVPYKQDKMDIIRDCKISKKHFEKLQDVIEKQHEFLISVFDGISPEEITQELITIVK